MPLHRIYRDELPETTKLRETTEDSFIGEAIKLESDSQLVKYEFAKALYHNQYGFIYNESYPKFIERLWKALKQKKDNIKSNDDVLREYLVTTEEAWNEK